MTDKEIRVYHSEYIRKFVNKVKNMTKKELQNEYEDYSDLFYTIGYNGCDQSKKWEYEIIMKNLTTLLLKKTTREKFAELKAITNFKTNDDFLLDLMKFYELNLDIIVNDKHEQILEKAKEYISKVINNKT